MGKDSNWVDVNIANMMINPQGVRALGSIHGAFVMAILTRRHFECKNANELTPDGSFRLPKDLLEETIGLKSPAINKHLHILEAKGAIAILNGETGESRLFAINEKIIKAVEDCMNRNLDNAKKEGGAGYAKRSEN